MKETLRFAPLFLAFLLLAACQTAKPVPQPEPTTTTSSTSTTTTTTTSTTTTTIAKQQAMAPEPIAPGQSLIQTELSGFSPTAENGRNTMTISLLFAHPEAVKTWKVTIASDKGNVRVVSGTGAALPSSLDWDGKTDKGAVAAEGIYSASLSIDYGASYKPGAATSTRFILDSTPPTARIRVSPALFSPVEEGDRVSISIDAAASLAKLDSWSMDIYDPGGNLFRSFDGKWPNATVEWDGKGIGGDLVVSAEDYPVTVKLRDEFGNVGLSKSTIPIDIIVVKQGEDFRIANSRIYFKDFTADYRDVAPDLRAQNVTRLDQLAERLKKFPGYRIKIVGHAVMIHWDDAVLGKLEQESVLIPLSAARAEAIKQALADRGLDPAIMTTEGVGAADPLVPDSDFANRWRNRRTAIFLLK